MQTSLSFSGDPLLLRLNLCVLFLCFANPVSASVVQLYGAEAAFPSRFYNVNVSNGSLTSIGTSNTFLASMDFSPSGVLYAASTAIEEVNPISGLSINRRSLNFIGGPTTSDILTGLTFSPSGDLYGIGNGNGNLWKVDLATANAQFIGTSVTTLAPFALEFGPGGKLYSAGFDLHEIDPLTASATLLGRIVPPGGALINGLDFASDGILYGVSGSLTSDALYRINVSTGLGTLIGTTVGNLGSIASRPGPFGVVPEPSGLAIWSLGIMIGLPLYRARKTT